MRHKKDMYKHNLHISFLLLCLFNSSLNSDQIQDNEDLEPACHSSKSNSINSDGKKCDDSREYEGICQILPYFYEQRNKILKLI